MPTLDQAPISDLVKMILIGDSGTGKTGSLVSLVKAGYKLRIMDFDGLLRVLIEQIRRQCPDKIKNVSYLTFQDKLIASPSGPMPDGVPTAFNRAIGALLKWKDGAEDLGNPALWGPDCVLVIDTFTRVSDCALRWGDSMTPVGKSGRADGRAGYWTAQQAILELMTILNSPTFNTNVILVAHVAYQERGDGIIRGFPRAVGKAINTEIPGFFEHVLVAERTGDGVNATRTIKAVTNGLVETKSPILDNHPELLAPMPLNEALAKYFLAARGKAPSSGDKVAALKSIG
jgi:hypothetical protein